MADQKSLKLIGWALGCITAMVMLVGAVVVQKAVATPGQPSAVLTSAD